MPGSQLFPQFLPKQTRFLTAENPSPVKMSGTFSQLEGAFASLESFLGNGIDYHVTNDVDRKMLFNISTAIGRTDRLYKPINQAPTLEFMQYAWGLDIVEYDRQTGILSFIYDLMALTIPANAHSGWEFGIFYRGEGELLNLDGLHGVQGENIVWTSIPDTGGEWKWATFEITGDTIHYLKFRMPENVTTFEIQAMYIMDPSIYNGVYNKGYTSPLDNAAYWIMKTPCKYSKPGIDNPCQVKTCNYCIGQTYNYDRTSPGFGQPICVSLDDDNENGAYYIDNMQQASISYSPTLFADDDERFQYLTIQSPILTSHNPYSIRFKPFHMHTEDLDAQIPVNQCVIYDTENSSATVKYLTNLYSAGGLGQNIRGDIFYIKDKQEVAAGEGNPKRYLIFDLLTFVNLPRPVDAVDHIAVYASDNE
jgi:hypothetical protein